MVAVETVVAVVSVAAAAFDGSFWDRTSKCAPTAYSSNSAGICLPQPPSSASLC